MPVIARDYLDFQQRGGIADLSVRAKFRLTGADRIRYLNGQVTANITRLTPAEAVPSCVTTAKGRLCGDIFISAEPDALLIDAEPELRESLLARLERYIISDDAALEDVTDSLALLHLLPAAHETAETLRASTLGDVPTPHLARRFTLRGGLDLLVPASEAAALLARWPLLSPELLEVLRIEAGLPRWGRELGEDTLPPEAGLDRTHIDYHKGCYIGQEVISRLKSVGHVNRQLTGFVPAGLLPGDSSPLLAAGLQLFAPGDPARPVGHLTSAVFSFALAKPIALGYLKRGSPIGDLLARPAQSDGLPIPTDGPAISVTAQALPFVP
jgi:tRNA-modifying protein YgfZ